MNNYGGGIMTTTKTVAIFWGKSWSSGTSTGNWKNKIAGKLPFLSILPPLLTTRQSTVRIY